MKTGVKVSAYALSGYTGGKEAGGTAQKIINEIRPFDILIIPFLGHCAISRNIDLCNSRVIGIDINPEVIGFWKEMNFPWIDLRCRNGWELTSQLLATSGLRGKKICIYCDPTYRMASIKSEIKPYPFTMTDEEHIKFLKAAKQWSILDYVDVVISHYPDDLYDSYLEGWRNFKYDSQIRKGLATEKLYMNYEHITGELQDYRWVGENKHERYNLKKRAARNLFEKLERMEVRKKQAMIYYLKAWLENPKNPSKEENSKID